MFTIVRSSLYETQVLTCNESEKVHGPRFSTNSVVGSGVRGALRPLRGTIRRSLAKWKILETLSVGDLSPRLLGSPS